MTVPAAEKLKAAHAISGLGGDEGSQHFQQMKAKLHEKLIAGVDMSMVRKLDPDWLREELRRGAEELCKSHAYLLSIDDRNKLIDELVYETLGFGPLEPLLADPTISDILINGPNTVYIERRGRLESTNIRFRDLTHLLNILQRIAGRVGRRIDEASPMVDARLPDGSRINAIIRPLALEGALVSIRRFSDAPLAANDLIQRKSASAEMIDFLSACVRARLNIMISGGTGSGKTTLLNMLSSYIPEGERIVTIEDAAELKLQQPHVGRLETRPPNLEGKGEVTARDLLRNSLRMRPDRIIIGECRGSEAFEMLNAMNTGHDGGMTTIHANDTRDAIGRLEMLIAMAAPELPIAFIHKRIASALQIVVQTARLSGGQRKITQISEVTGAQGDTVSMHDIFQFRRTGVDEQGNAIGQFESTGMRLQCMERLKAAGVELPNDLFARGAQDIDRLDAYSYKGQARRPRQ